MGVSEYILKQEDFVQAFSFAVNYYLSKNNHIGRTSGEPRGLGATLDSFLRGKLVEIGAKKIIESYLMNDIKVGLDFDIKPLKEVTPEPDIVSVIDGVTSRNPNYFIEIKTINKTDRWLGLTEEQMNTMETSADLRDIFCIYCSLNIENNSSNSSSSDLVGMVLKTLTNLEIFKDFSDINVAVRLEYILPLANLKDFGTIFSKGDHLYETNLFNEVKSIRLKNGMLKKNIKPFVETKTQNKFIYPKQIDDQVDLKHGKFNIKGNYKLYIKTNSKSTIYYIECISDTVIHNDIFGKFNLFANKIYKFNLITVGRDSILKRNNVWLSVNRLEQLIKDGYIQLPTTLIADIAKGI